mmetsp:Transcript_9999/g.18005  ORF Transcript_9999/g.18005 Transcript_9999/m.18005 type:complete len:457 (-) Transcript_9999:710-2080(-)|eukprot:CAMPEP_0182445360 /NCGR_PEP_ID=MMETSP1172-20130603/3511_1 /TAXON_ID=708627 /ORGANISM="Timspurckia oligopyrenoides, Strain CCMP3278" /LENGTH=456 /DNA_ID=CAMNT_0024641121 /DNA_START=1184 /DNA_END=2554 /DNA_ORIENTATION=-
MWIGWRFGWDFKSDAMIWKRIGVRSIVTHAVALSFGFIGGVYFTQNREFVQSRALSSFQNRQKQLLNLMSTSIPQDSKSYFNPEHSHTTLHPDSSSVTLPNHSPEPTNAPLSRYSLSDAIDKAGPAVVNITVTSETNSSKSVFKSFGGNIGPYRVGPVPVSSGSGFIISSDGLLLTNAHVVISAQRSQGSIHVTLQDGRSYTAEILGLDQNSDIAMLQLNYDTPEIPLPKVELGDSSKLRTGEWVVALGSPLTLRNSATAGIVSATEREAYEIGMSGGSPAFIQTDAAITLGNSGGPLIDGISGKVIGINTMKAASSEGISFAVPINYALEVVQQLREYGTVRRPFLGCKLLTLHVALADQLRSSAFNFPKTMDWAPKNTDELGVLVHDVLKGSPIAKSGIEPGDIIVQVDGHRISNTNQFLAELGHKVETDVKVVVIRGKDSKRFEFCVRPSVRK